MAWKLQRTLTALLFLAVLAAGTVYLALGYRGQVGSTLSSLLHGEGDAPVEDLFSLSDRLQAAAGRTEESLTDTLDRDHLFIRAYGLLQRAMGRQTVEDVEAQYTVARLSNGALTFADPTAAYDDYPDPAGYAAVLADLRDRLEETLSIPLLYVQAPQKASAYADASLPAGLSDFGDARADALLAALAGEGVDTLDLRPVFADTGRYDDLFFRTDHHWTPEGAFLAWQTVARVLAEDYGLTVDLTAADRSQWQTETLSGIFLGSQGKRVGELYGGTDDLELWSPVSGGQFRYLVPIRGYDRTGPFESSLLFPERLEEKDLYRSNPYTYYSGGDYPFARMQNLQNPDGPTVVLLRDSLSCTFAPFLTAGVGEVVTIDLRYFQDDLMEYISWVGADLVLYLYSPSALKQSVMFRTAPAE